MPESSASIGLPYDLPVRLGNTLRSRVLVLNPKSGALQGGTVVASLFKSIADKTPMSSPKLEVTALDPSPSGARRWLISLDKAKVKALADLPVDMAAGASGRRQAGIRTFYWTCSYETDDGASWPLYYGKLNIYLGASSG